MSLSVLKNTAWGVLGEFAVRGAKIAQVILIARILGAEDVGRFNYAIALAGLFSVLFDFGIVPVSVKTLSAAPDSSAFRLYGRMKLLVSFVGIFLLGIVAFFSDISPSEAWMAFGMGIYLALNDLATFVTVAYRARFEFWRETVWRSITALLQLAACCAALLLSQTIEAVVIVLIGAAVAGMAPLFVEWRRQPKKVDGLTGSLGMLTAVRQCLPIAGTVLVGSVYMNLDIVVLGNYASMEEVGWYSVAVKAIFSLMIMPLHYLQLATLPSLSAESVGKGSVNMDSRWLHGFVLSSSVGAVISVGTAMLAGPLLAFLFGSDFIEVAPVLVIFSLIGFMFYMYTPLSQWLLLHNRQKTSLCIYVAGMLVNIVAVFLFIPRWGLWGAVAAAFCTHATIVTINVALVLRHNNFSNNRAEFLALFKLAFATSVAIAVLYLEIGGSPVCNLLAVAMLVVIAHRELISLYKHLAFISRGFLARA